MTTRINGGIINSQTLSGNLRYFKMSGPFAWTISNGSVNLPVKVHGGKILADSYTVVGNNKPVPESAAELAFRIITSQCDITVISCRPALYGATTEIHFACSASAFGWGSDTPGYSAGSASLPEDMTAAAPQMQAAVRALGNKTVYVSVGAANQTAVPVTASVNMATVVITEVPFGLV